MFFAYLPQQHIENSKQELLIITDPQEHITALELYYFMMLRCKF